jgi:NADH:ubiquinone oxidoreductase subunit
MLYSVDSLGRRFSHMGLLSYLGVHSPAHFRLNALLSFGKCVGRDGEGNRYYRAPLSAAVQTASRRERRWVIYKNRPDASAIPPEWHGWMHYQTDIVPDTGGPQYRRSWQKPHKKNMTGTSAAYLPPGHILAGGKRAPATGDYEAWIPDQDLK